MFIAPLINSDAAFAFGAAGHHAVCEIAYAELTDTVRRKVDEVLQADPDTRFHNFGRACGWPDLFNEFGSILSKYGSDHYINTPRGSVAITECFDSDGTPIDRCLLGAIERMSLVLTDGAGSDLGDRNKGFAANKTEAIRFLGHWLGDIHQPLHASYADDRGGNDVHVEGVQGCARSGVTKLHTVWDIYEKLWVPLQQSLQQAFHVIADYRAYQGDPRTFLFDDKIVPFAAGQKEKLREASLYNLGVAAAAVTDGRVGDGLIELNEVSDPPEVQLHNHDIYLLTAQTIEPVASIGDYVVVSNYAEIHDRNLVIAGRDGQLLARRYELPETDPHVAVLSASAMNPRSIAKPILASIDKTRFRKIVGTLFSRGQSNPIQSADEVIPVTEPAEFMALLDNARLFRVDGHSAEPIALDGQYLITGRTVTVQKDMIDFSGRLVIAGDGDGARYFKRFRSMGTGVVVLESLNPDGQNSAIVASLDGSVGVKITSIVPVLGVLFELPRSN